MKSKGITLVSLIITMIILVILAGVGLTITASVINNARKSTFLAKMSSIEETVSLRIMSNEVGLLTGEVTNEEVFQTKMLAEELEELDDSVKYEILTAWQLEQGVEPSPTLEEIDIEITELTDFLFKLGEDITGDSSYASIYDSKVGAVYKIKPLVISGKTLVGTGNTGMLAGKKKILKEEKETEKKIVVTKGAYVKTKGTEEDYFVCVPNFDSFNIDTTYYVTYEENTSSLTPIIGNKIGRDAPENWYDYENQKWPNIVTMNNGKKAYWVWIPRYVYKITYYTDAAKTILSENNNITAYGTVDVKFVDIDNMHKTASGTKTNYVKTEGYIVPEGFTFGDEELAGIWVGKYEVSDAVVNDELKQATIVTYNNKIVVEPTYGVTNAETAIYDIYLDGTKVKSQVTLPQELTNLSSGREFEVTTVRYSGTSPVNSFTKKVKTEVVAPNIPNLSNFNSKITYYVTYDATGNPILGNRIGKGEPEIWYDYNKQQRATVLVSDDHGIEYFTWIPRHEKELGITGTRVYNTTTAGYNMDINFIPDSKTEPSAGYEIPEEFTVEGVALDGVWIASGKNETRTMKRASIIAEDNNIKVDIISNIANRDITKNDVYVDGVKVHSGNLSYVISEIDGNRDYEISVRGYYTVNGKLSPTNTYTRILKTGKAIANVPNFTGLNKSTTYYVTFNDNGTPIIGNNLNGAAPENWYDYDNQKWANILTNNNGKTSYWVWIPRYEYEAIPEGMEYTTTDGVSAVQAHFISKNQETATEGFIIPEAFTFGGEHLSGIWVGKYEVSEPVANDAKKKATIVTYTDKIVVEPTHGATNSDTAVNDIYLDGVKVKSQVTLPQELTGLDSGREYEVAVIRYSGANPVNSYNKKVKTEVVAPNIPNLSNFDEKITYYVTYDASGNPIIGNRIGKGEPEIWYDYNKQQRATVLVSDDNGIEYFTWIPRHEKELGLTGTRVYNTTTDGYDVDINFIPVSKIEPSAGYEIPEEYTVEGVALDGVWIASGKNETRTMKRASIEAEDNVIKADIISTITNRDATKNDVYVDGVKVHSGELPYEITNLEENKAYEIAVRGYYTENGKLSPTNTYKRTLRVGKAIPNAPEFTGLNKSRTYYVTFNDNGTPVIGNNLNGAAPENWYDYDNQKWANILTDNNGKKAYWVWIPRYEYEAIPEGMTYTTTDGVSAVQAHFILKSQEEATEGFIIPEAFTFGGEHLSGIWVGKYEVSDQIANDLKKKATIVTYTDKIVVEPTHGATNSNIEINDIYLDGVKVKSQVTLPQELTGLDSGREYEVAVIRYSGANPVNSYTKKVKTEVVAPNIPDLSIFNSKITYYVTYDANGNPIVGNKIGKGEPESWYNYNEQRRATVIVSDDNGIEYFTWIPRHEKELGLTGTRVYNTTTDGYDVDINFIPATKTEPSAGYEIPQEFTVEGVEHSGVWIASGKVATRTMKRASIAAEDNVIKADIISTITNRDATKNDVYVDGIKVHSENLPYEISGLEQNREYEISVRGYYTENGKLVPTNTYTRIVRIGKSMPNAPEFTGLNKSRTYYVTFNDNGTPVIGNNLNGAAPENWYDYDNQKWANILTDNNGKKAYWVWIPRYEYEAIPEGMTYTTTDGDSAVQAHFISKNQETATDGFIIPEAFTFGGEHLSGIWVGKYEVSDQIANDLKKKATIVAYSNKIVVEPTHGATNSNTEINDIYLDGVKVKSQVTLPQELTGLDSGREYEVAVIRYSGANPVNSYTKKVKTEVVAPNIPDLSIFNSKITYYVTYDATGNPIVGNKIGKAEPESWYNYNEQRRATVLVSDDNGIEYFTWIPRHEKEKGLTGTRVYNTTTDGYDVDINFIPATKTEPSAGYEIPEEFSTENEEFSGVWLRSGKVATRTMKRATIEATNNSIKVNIISNITNRDVTKNDVYVNGIKVHSETLEHTINDIDENEDYEISVRGYYTENGKLVPTNTYTRTIKAINTTPNAPDFTGLNKSTTYYVTFDDNGTPIIGNNLNGAAPENWYDYSRTNRKWANILTDNNGKKAYWVWIPRYEYEAIPEGMTYNASDGDYAVEAHFIPKSQTTATPGFIIPEGFVFGGEHLSGIWVGKYEVSD